MTGTPLLQVTDLRVGYGGAAVLHGASFSVTGGEVAALLGPNGAGKTTLARTLLGRLRPISGSIHLAGESVIGLQTHVLIRKGLALVPEGRMLIKDLSTEDNLRLGGIAHTLKGARTEDLEFVYEQFPRLRERRAIAAGLLSGGEQQMVAIGRALTMRPRVLVLDEPSLGLAPLIVKALFTTIRRLADLGTAVLVAEQNVRAALEIADTAHVLIQGRIARSGPATDIGHSNELVELYLGHKEAEQLRQR
jgi:branched-chain amino acid transport system ATP-binding protein